MALSMLLIGAGEHRRGWFEIGSRFVVVDTLVHNFLVRTGILSRLGASHAYGAKCFSSDGCAGVLLKIAKDIDCRAFDPTYPAMFPRFVQSAVWRFCSQIGLGICNGNQIDDQRRCDNENCPPFSWLRSYRS